MSNQLDAYNQHWYRGEVCNFIPRKVDLSSNIEEYILKGWLPSSPFINKKHHTAAFGSCFADHIQNYLREREYNVPNITDCNVTKYGAGMVNTFTIRQHFEWAYYDRDFQEDVWYPEKHIFPQSLTTGEFKKLTRDLFDRTEVFIITLGLSEVWYSKKTHDVFWKAIPGRIFDSSRHGFRVSTCQENTDNLNVIINCIREHCPEAYIIFTLSPVRLRATFRSVSAITSNSASKAILRASIDEVMRAHKGDERLFYWPSYEIVTDVFPAAYKPDNIHPTKEVVDTILSLFGQYYLVG